ncbi:MAG: disulfide bond formation protein B [Acetobacteraceae bacterium]|nr:disulfide bond formation protein B [Acetobacteraceae bacterium]
MPPISLRAGLTLAALSLSAALFAAMASEWWGGLVPCALCLLGRWPYRVAIALALLGLVLPRRLAAWCAGAVVLAMLASAAIGVVHVGVEAGWWPSPLPGCVARFTPGAGVADLPARPAKPCDEPTYLIPGLPLSMAAMSLIFSLATAAAMAAVLLCHRPRPTRLP